MNIKNLLLLILILLCKANLIQAQRLAFTSDSLWCDHLNEIIKCASIDEITERISRDVRDSSYVAPLRPDLRLTFAPNELIKKEYGKVSYMCYLMTGEKTNDNIEKQLSWWHKKIKACLSLWDEARIKNGDLSLTVPDDYFFTNSEDETAVRLDIVKDNGYHVRLRIY